uniref:Uncharacterized protein n=1 Tax=Nelumbo nucifera TaxID=4432 RepID=A0A822ZS08_NELNU|nr:TPA_asm: hypothetical protein HUJ06_017604 [Nelumbo nucifera]
MDNAGSFLMAGIEISIRLLLRREMQTIACEIANGSYVPIIQTKQEAMHRFWSLSKLEAEERLSETLRVMPIVDLETLTLCLVGDPNVGKSSLVRILSKGKPELAKL